MADETGTTIPLILGFFIIALLLVAGSVAASDAYLDQRSLQHTCDGAVLAGANALNSDPVFASDFGSYGALPIRPAVQQAIADYLYRDAARSDVQLESAQVASDGAVTITCVQRLPVAFGAMFGYSDGISHRATVTARARIG